MKIYKLSIRLILKQMKDLYTYDVCRYFWQF